MARNLGLNHALTLTPITTSNVEAGDIDLNTYLKDQSIFAITEGHVAAPTGPGLGIDVDEDMIRKISAETSPWPPKEFFGPDGSIREW